MQPLPHTCGGSNAEERPSSTNYVKLHFKHPYRFNSHKLKVPSFRRNNNAEKGDTKFVCKECKMVFDTKDSLELHKRKSRHYTGLIYFGKNER
jgi:hypothetical protein